MSEATPVENGSNKPNKPPVNLALIVAVVALGLTGWQYLDTRQQLNKAQQALAERLADAGGSTKALQNQAELTQASTRELQAKLALIEARVNESAGQYATLSGMYQELTKDRSDWLLSEVEHTLGVASQQLQLAGNVSGAISALEGVQTRLAQVDNPGLIGVKRAVAKDLETLKALPYLDTVGLTVKLDTLMLGAETLPLVIDHHRLGGKPVAQASVAADAPWWTRLAGELTQSLGDLVRIRRMDKPEALLLSPEQAFFLRENLKMRLLDARLALIQRDGATYQADLAAAGQYAARYFDRDAPTTRQWQAMLSEVASVRLSVTLPDLSASLKAVREAQGNKGE
ncbi:uroporphyrinogen-III C-methyltransferase [Vogesella sp. LYT5W]|uniref:Uroporphyrinogen-III C-methyltransferase n=1 Tax=Vogesella margarita TaxID=2984199 RepID=A0ABT5IKX6_9NEIS|nr:uroporphyrinogen-III C-methyltransferase [Vogesella margarita]MDC7713219.1 uroporphyrinogen-III C-methyltransferase [Vogesella margarita]